MNTEEFYNYCFNFKGVTDDFPFDKETLAFRVGGKIFALTDISDFKSINLKCEPEKAIELRDRFHAIQPGYHMNKKHWNTIFLNLDVDDKLLFELIDHSYKLVYYSLPKKIRDEITLG